MQFEFLCFLRTLRIFFWFAAFSIWNLFSFEFQVQRVTALSTVLFTAYTVHWTLVHLLPVFTETLLLSSIIHKSCSCMNMGSMYSRLCILHTTWYSVVKSKSVAPHEKYGNILPCTYSSTVSAASWEQGGRRRTKAHMHHLSVSSNHQNSDVATCLFVVAVVL